MVTTLQQVKRRAFGLTILSELPLPELPEASADHIETDVTVRIGDLSGVWQAFAEPGRTSSVTEDRLLFRIEGTAIYEVRGGREIVVSPEEKAQPDKVRLYLLGTCMGALLQQRRILPLHGSAVLINGKVYAFIGDSGAGKSTMASCLLQRGYSLVSDDVIAVAGPNETVPYVMPAYPQQKLWQTSLDGLGIAGASFKPIIERVDKFAVPVTEAFNGSPVPLGGIFVLSRAETAEIEITDVPRFLGMAILQYHTFRKSLIEGFGLNEWHFRSAVALAGRVPLKKLGRPAESVGFTANRMADRVLEFISKEG
ncbi:aldolase [Cohnella sp. GbtcB17]|uniref:aldolase n=1 Tax=Cohnella sp. GbtcB17 TaxID=2824762 RepID=UPI001C2FFAF3|nr:aldolase [Cohnella sp. GbtcB17]